GVRWEGDGPPHDRNGLPLRTVRGMDDPATLELAPAGSPLWPTERTNFAPRLGIGYQLRSNPGWETQLRGNLGLFYGLSSSAASRVALGAPYLVSRPLGASSYPIATAQATPPASELSVPYSLLYAFPQDFHAPRVLEWNAGVEQHLGPHWMGIAEYVGSTGDRLLHRELLLPSEGLNPQFSIIELINNRSKSNYNALQMRLARAFGSGVRIWGTYTFSHSLDISSSLAHPMPFYLTYNPELDYGNSDFDVSHSLAIVATYTSKANFDWTWLRRTLTDWSIASSLRARTGMPINVMTGSDLIDLGYTKSDYRRPDRILGQSFWTRGAQYPGGRALNPAAFQANTTVLQGTLARNAVRGFGVWQEDLSLTRTLPLRENLRLGLRMDVFNLFNHPSFGDPGTQYTTTNLLTSPTFGVSSATLARSLGHGGADGGYNPAYQIGGERAIQLAAQIKF
ncbi:MAG TPA: hypothetical protein VK638_32660, partial [Edaphobacter sp.]|nr:hypothetical protein [Edaphobacter sp.]